jgi:hypothetical protein
MMGDTLRHLGRGPRHQAQYERGVL